ncbi:MAG TPA: sigma-70 family RNA polymerase sigma factor [Myxococcaceae bacterium]|nr:sigma-70 family RNA polymerase sigma factor [Myxococcaceae bacterium]
MARPTDGRDAVEPDTPSSPTTFEEPLRLRYALLVAEVTELLRAWNAGDPRAQEKLLPLVYRELRRRAAAYLRGERGGHTLVATALVHEAYLRLVDQRSGYVNRTQFFAIAATMMRRVLADHARARAAGKRPPPELRIGLDEAPLAAADPSSEVDLLSLDRALDELAARDPRQARLVELRYFGGLTAEETAEALGVSLATVKREWTSARAWLYAFLTRGT